MRETVPSFNFRQYCATHESAHIINLLTAIQLEPRNHGKNIRIELLLLDLIQTLNGEGRTDFKILRKILLKIPRNPAEDPYEELFTERVWFFGGNFIVFPGINSFSADYLRNIIVVLNWAHQRKSLPELCLHAIFKGIQLILVLGNELATRAGLNGNEDGAVSNIDRLEVPKRTLDFSFSNQELSGIMKRNGIGTSILKEFIWDEEKHPILKDSEVEMNHPLLEHPLVYFDSQLYFTLPTAQTLTILAYIKRICRSYKVWEQIESDYHQYCWTLCEVACRSMAWKQAQTKLPERPKGLPVFEEIYQFDYNRMAYVSYLYIPDDRIDSELVSQIFEDYNLRLKQIATYLRTTACCEVMTIVLKGSSGESYSFPLDKGTEHNLIVDFSTSEFLSLVEAENWGHLDLWKFCRYYSITKERKITLILSSVDAYAFYKENGYSFYFDDQDLDSIILNSGYGSYLIRNYKLARDEHAAFIINETNGVAGYLPVKRRREFAPIYDLINDGNSPEVLTLLKCFSSNLWVSNKQATSKDVWNCIWMYIEAILFWTFKMQKHIAHLINRIEEQSVFVELIFHDSLINLNGNDYERASDTQEFTFEKTKYGVKIFIPDRYNQLIIKKDNEFEFHLLLGTLKSLMSSCGLSDSIKELEQILDQHFPIGSAKMILGFHTKDDLRFDSRWLGINHRITEAQANMLHDELLDVFAEPIPKIVPEDQQVEFCNKMVLKLFRRLVNLLNEYDWHSTINMLMLLNESIIYHRVLSEIRVPAQLHCYADIETEFERIQEQESALVRTAISTRGLIEFLSFYQSSGDKRIGYDEIDELLVLLDTITTWGWQSDSIHLGLANPRISVLPSGRIGTDKSYQNEILHPYRNAHLSEQLTEQMHSYSDRMNFGDTKKSKGAKQNKLRAEINAAFLSDFGYGFATLLAVLKIASEYAAIQERSICEIRKADFIKMICAEMKESILVEVPFAVDALILNLNKDQTIDPIQGYQSKELYPWLFNRQLSLHRKPIICFSRDGEEFLTWGMKATVDSSSYIYNLVWAARLKPCGKKLSKVFGKILFERGDEFRFDVKEWIKNNSDFDVVDYEVNIGPNCHLNADFKLGDIDVLAYHRGERTVLAIECKRTHQAKTALEIKTEYDNYFGRPGKTGMIQKHVGRHVWLVDNKNVLNKFLGLGSIRKIESMVVTSEILPASFIKAHDARIPLISFIQLKQRLKRRA